MNNESIIESRTIDKVLALKEELKQELKESMRIEIEELDEGNKRLASFFNGHSHALTKVIKKLDELVK
jgi:hypothetical protein